jgi:outer membrane cobalamin receptor
MICKAFQSHHACLAGMAFMLSHAATALAQEKKDSTVAPSPLEAVVVSATRSEQRVESLPSPVKVIGSPEIKASTASSVQDLLRSIPGFTLRDYQSGLISGPSQSIATFRGLGGSSAGRVLILLDGVPIGDPFSGFLDWGRIPVPMLASAEVIRGGGSIIWGSRALAGVVNLRTISPRHNGLDILAERGSFNTSHAAGTASVRTDKLTAVVAADYLDTDGFIVTPPKQQGPVDDALTSRKAVVAAKLSYDLTPALQASFAGSAFKGGDKPWGILDNERFTEGRAGLRWLTQSHGILTATGFANDRLALSKSFSVNSARTTETPQRFGTSPAQSQGLFAQWTQLLGEHHEVTSGLDFTSAGGSFAEDYGFVKPAFTAQRNAAGDQQIAGVFVQDAADLGHAIRMVASARVDRVHSSNGQFTVRSLPAGTLMSDSTIIDHSDVRPTWSLGFRRQQTTWLGLRVNGYESFRAPSLYEMYYPRFSSRGTVTEANGELEAERLRGVEGGFDLAAGRSALLRITAFANRVASPIYDITIGTAGTTAKVIDPCGLMPPAQTCSQRQNVSALQSDGVESDLSWSPSAMWRLNAAYSYSSAYVHAPGKPVDGKEAIRSAPHSAFASVTFDQPRWFSASVEGRYVSSRFDDDLNTIKLDGFRVFGLRVNREIGSRATAHVKVDNLLNEFYETTRASSGLAERGAPRWVTFGLRTTW